MKTIKKLYTNFTFCFRYSPPDLLSGQISGLCPWIPLGDFRPPDPSGPATHHVGGWARGVRPEGYLCHCITLGTPMVSWRTCRGIECYCVLSGYRLGTHMIFVLVSVVTEQEPRYGSAMYAHHCPTTCLQTSQSLVQQSLCGETHKQHN